MNPTYDFDGQVALVTGASSGMGLATAEAFSDSGAAVVLADINEKALQTVAEKLTSAGRKALSVVCDVSNEAQVANMIERAVAHFGSSIWPSTTRASKCRRAMRLTRPRRISIG
jgi:NAD(P)-dependent dehydrogenase (short-subunit alcohol dehydrogenase family)